MCNSFPCGKQIAWKKVHETRAVSVKQSVCDFIKSHEFSYSWSEKGWLN